ncbi:ribosomal RNA-processing protein 7 homolog A isoform X2 [Dromiciops gliroides]|uniref:ribosomal RNA-processing protein 7 homolog A isoform X2 n=1 Tax=Dromiciops gliroides TaxID=33562 RepID=UPI001CC350BC|nr:ribosomal RNA-processing protein 7 homolog A isoform X2 [Dromiciops gliroides]
METGAIPIKFSQEQEASHFLYVKEHRVRGGTESCWPSERTLFVLNVPPYCSEGCLAQLFSSCGPIQSVNLHDKPDLSETPKTSASAFFCSKSVPGFQVAYVVFVKPASVLKAVALQGPLIISTERHPVKTGIEKWIADYTDSLVDPEALRVEVDKFMEEYDKKIAMEDAKAEAEEGVPDEEGWVKVTRKGRRPGLPRSEAASLRVLEKEKRKKARKELLNFYAWQHRETKMEHLAQLRKKFEEDKQRIALMRAQRKFRPY